VVLAITIGVARVYNSQHDTTDVLAGWILGGLWAGAVRSRVGVHGYE
jgi:membrane-associated phospholipid phosphatase